jgi:hypothetical protein
LFKSKCVFYGQGTEKPLPDFFALKACAVSKDVEELLAMRISE